MEKNTIILSIIVVNTNDAPHIQDCLTSLLESKGKFAGVEILVVDHFSNDDSADLLAKLNGNGINVIQKENEGFGSACNFGAKKARGEWVLFLNPDTWVDLKFIEILLDRICISENKKFGSIGIKNLDPKSGDQAVKYSVLKVNFLARAKLVQRYDNHLFNAGTSVLFVKERFESFSGFSKFIFIYNEDVDLGLRLFRAGFDHIVIEEPRVWHIGSAKTGKDWRVKAHWYARGEIITILNNFNFLLPILLSLHIALYMSVTVYLLCSGKVTQAIQILRQYYNLICQLDAVLHTRKLTQRNFVRSELAVFLRSRVK